MTDAPVFPLAGKRVFVAGHNGMVGRALVRRLEREPVELLTAPRAELDLTDPRAVDAWLQASRPDIVVVAAAKVGGIHANSTLPVDFLEDNLLIQTNLMRSSHRAGVDRLLFLGSSCIYPRDCPQPIREEYLLTGPLEPTNDAYALAKIAGLRLVRAYRQQQGRRWIAAMPTNLYGPFDNFHPETSHVLPALIRRFHEAQVGGTPIASMEEPQAAQAAVATQEAVTPNAAAAAGSHVGQDPIGPAAQAGQSPVAPGEAAHPYAAAAAATQVGQRPIGAAAQQTSEAGAAAGSHVGQDPIEPAAQAGQSAVATQSDPIEPAARGEVTVWGSGNPRREFLHVDDLADACVHLLRHYDDPTAINIGSGSDLTIRALAEAIAHTTRFEGSLAFDATRPDGTPRKLLDTSRLTALGWRPSIALDEGLASTYAWFKEHAAEARGMEKGRAA